MSTDTCVVCGEARQPCTYPHGAPICTLCSPPPPPSRMGELAQERARLATWADRCWLDSVTLLESMETALERIEEIDLAMGVDPALGDCDGNGAGTAEETR